MPTKKKKRFRNVHQTTQTTSFNFISLTLLKFLILSFFVTKDQDSRESTIRGNKYDAGQDRLLNG